MTKIYECDFEEVWDAHLRWAVLSGSVRRHFLAGLFVLPWIIMARGVFDPWMEGWRGAAVIITSLLVILVTPWWRYRCEVRRRMLAEVGPSLSISTMVTLDDSGISLHWSDTLVSYPWSTVSRFQVTRSYLEVYQSRTQYVRIPKRIFTTAECQEWIDVIRQKVANSR